MPFWWARRRKPWYTSWRLRRKRRWPQRRKRYRRRRYRRPLRRRRRKRRRRYKVRRKKATLTLKQWQPDSIVKCKIKGFTTLVAGSEGRQFFCYTNELDSYPQPKAPGGGGFGCMVFSLQYLYQQWLAHNNIWTKSNDYKDLCRYLYTTVTLYRHPTTDFIVQYSRMPPFILNKYSYSDMHPYNMLLSKHHKVLLSAKTNPNGKLKMRLKIKPPKQMLNKWFFQEQFTETALFQIQATAANMGFSIYGPNTQSQLLTFYALNTNFYQTHNWAQYTDTKPYLPYPLYPTTTKPKYHYPTKTGESTTEVMTDNYYNSIKYDTGFFQSKVLQATKITNVQGALTHERPITIARYNPALDTGQGTTVWLVSILADNHWAKPSDKDLYITGRPLWMAFYGFWNYITKIKKTKDYLKQAMFVVECPSAIRLVTGTTQKVFPIIDYSFLLGNMPYGELLTDIDKKLWYPSAHKQQEIINAIVESGPYIPKYAYLKESTWNLQLKYTFHFKWGGPEVTDQPVQNPKDQGKYDVPDTIFETVQISNPLKQKCQSMLRAWDYRRGFITTAALKRMSENLPTDTDFQSDEGQTPKKKKKITAELPNPQEDQEEIQTCLLSLFEEDSYQESEKDLHKLIQHQQQQQQKLKCNILQLLMDLKKKQRILQLQAGIE
nr:MAG: ORF1 [Torque teno midi virus]